MNCLSLHILIFCSIFLFSSSERICEKQGTCKRCDGKGRFSYYSCDSDDDCFKQESCREGFCCPKVNSTFFEDPLNRQFSSSFFDESSISGSSCPDGSPWMRLCKTDNDCLFGDEICAQGKCCQSCISKRRQIIREHSSEYLIGNHVPQCSDDGRFYQLKQCIHGFQLECFCTNLYGERINPIDVDEKGIVCGNGEKAQQNDPRLNLPEHFLTLKRGLMQETININPGSNCIDSNKEYRHCRSACFVTCDTRTRPICPYAGRCEQGCQCKLPYILESSNNLENSKCVLPAECPSNTEPLPTPGKVIYRPPLLPLNAEANIDNSYVSQFPHGAIGHNIDRSKQMHCSDPLKNFLTCGSACPSACERLVPACSFQCVSGCFCRTPYVLSDMNDANSACILPQHCEIQGKKNPFDPEPLFEGFYLQTTTSNPDEETSSTISSTTVKSEEINTTTTTIQSTTLPPITCADPNKEFKSCASNCPLACDNLDASICTPCVGGCFCKNGYVFESVKNWTDGQCIKINDCHQHNSSMISSSIDNINSEAIGAKLYSLDGNIEIGTFIFSTANDQKIRFDSRITYLPKTKSKTFVLTIHKYGSLTTDSNCESIGDIIEINPVYIYPYPNGTLLYLNDVKLPYITSYTFEATTEFAAKSVGAVIGRSLALHSLSDPTSKNISSPLGCATIGILKNKN